MIIFKQHVLIFFILTTGLISAEAGVYDLPPLKTGYPAYSQLYSDVKASSASATGLGFTEADETLNCVYAYLHPQSPYQYDTSYRDRMVLLLDTRFSHWGNGDSLTDMSSSFQSLYAYMLMKHYRYDDIAAHISDWERGIEQHCDRTLTHSLLFDDHKVGSLWLNGHIRLAMGVYFAGEALNNSIYKQKAGDAINLCMSRAVTHDGGTLYVGYQNEVPTYHSHSIYFMMWWWKITGSVEMEAALIKTLNYVPLSVEPSGFQEQSTAIAYKHMYNGIRGLGSALAKAYMFGEKYNYYLGQQIESRYSRGWSLLYSMLYRDGLTSVKPPENFILFDRAIQGPRGRFSDWAFVGTGRNVQTSDPELPDEAVAGAMCGKNTFVGALTLRPWENNTSLDAAFDGACVQFKHKTGVETNWSRGNVNRFLAQDEHTTTIVRDNFSTLTTSYRITNRVSAGADKPWENYRTDWIGKQTWVMTEDRMIGLIQIENETPQTVYGLNTRFILCGGRKNILGETKPLNEVEGHTYEFGKLRFKIHDETFGGDVVTERFGITGTEGDDRSVKIKLHDVQDHRDDTLIDYPAGTVRWALVEVTKEGQTYATSINNVLKNNKYTAVVEFKDSKRKYRIIQNLTGSERTYNGNMWPNADDITVHKSWTSAVETEKRESVGSVAISQIIPPYGHCIVIASNERSDHQPGTNYYEDIFTQGETPYSFQQISLVEGYNLLGLQVAPNDLSFSSLLPGLSNKIAVTDQNKITVDMENGEWNPEKGYLIKSSNNIDLTIQGPSNRSNAIDLRTGLNIYPFRGDEPIDALTFLEDELHRIDYVRDENGNSIRLINGRWINTIGNFAPGKSYVIIAK